MSLSQAGNALSAVTPFALNWRGLAGYQHNSTADQAVSSLNDAAQNQQMSTDFGNNSVQVSLSAAARALAAFDGSGTSSSAGGASGTAGAGSAGASGGTDAAGGSLAPGTSDFDQEAAYLGGLTDSSLVAMGIITPDQQAGTQITFSSLSYNVSESASASVSQQDGQTVATLGSEQQAEFVGQGQITTSDGRTYDFEVEVDLDQSQQLAAASGTGAAAQSNVLDDTVPTAGPDNVPLTAPSVVGNPPTSDASADASSGSFLSGTGLNWNSILDQSQSLLELLDSLGMANSATQSSAAANAAGVTTSSSNANTASSASSTQGAGAAAASGTSQSAANTAQASQAAAVQQAA